MRILILSMAACLLGACAAPKPLPRAALVPLYDLPPPPPPMPKVVDTAPVQPPQVTPAPAPAPVQQPATTPIYRTVVEIVEVPVEVEVEVPVAGNRSSLPAREPYSRYDDYLRYRAAYRPYLRSRFPINTAVGAGIGAIIGHQRGRRDRGALIGGGLGLLMDLSRW